jgi:radical SAM/Cys-rich protein
MRRVLDAARRAAVGTVDLTGGSPEFNPDLRRFIEALRRDGRRIILRTNLTAMLERGMGTLPAFLRARGVEVVASLPCYTKANVDAQRGAGVFDRSIEVLRRLNALGYGSEIRLDLVYNPGGAFLPGEQASLQADYRRELSEGYGIVFTNLRALANMPIGRFREHLSAGHAEAEYLSTLESSFNPATIAGLMCRRQVSVGWDGTLYDCDFNLALGLPVNHGAPDHVKDFDAGALASRRIVTGGHCFGCTAGAGSSCGGALAG